MEDKKNFQEYKKLFNDICLRIEENFPFQSKKELKEFNNYCSIRYNTISNLNNDNDFFLFIKEFLVGLKHSHLGLDGFSYKLYSPKNYKVELIDNKFYLFKNKKYLGQIIEVDDKKPEDILKKAKKLISGSTEQYIQSQSLKFILTSKNSGLVKLKTKIDGKVSYGDIKRYPLTGLAKTKNIYYKFLENNIGYLKINLWIDNKKTKAEINKVIKSFNKIKGLIIDLRNSQGGSSFVSDLLTSHFFNKKVLFGTNKRRISKENLKLKKYYYHIHPKEPYFDKPIIILTNSQSFSSSELFVAGMQDNKRATIMGEITGGGTGNPKKFIFNYSSIELILYVPTWVYNKINNKLIEGIGIKPDVVIRPKLESLRNNIDEVLEKAVDKFKNL